MPLRDYECKSCGHEQEELIRRDEEEADLRCQKCGGSQLARQISLPAPSASSCDEGFG
jgi:putative FmdB family regulatory protein